MIISFNLFKKSCYNKVIVELEILKKACLPTHRSIFLYLTLLKISAIKHSISLHRGMYPDVSEKFINSFRLQNAWECNEAIIYYIA